MKAAAKLLWISATVLVALAIGVYVLRFDPPAVGTSADLPAVGGPFTLVAHDGRSVTEADFRGRYMLVYFGYTYCPDVCPTTLTVMADALDRLGPMAERIVPVFVSVDPARDTPEHLAMYVAYFHPRLVGLTGTPEQVAAVARAYRVYYAKVSEEGADADDYVMDHTAIVYLMGPEGDFLAHFTHGTDAETMAARLRALLAKTEAK